MSCEKCFVPSLFSTFNSSILTLKLDDSSKHQAFMGPCRRTASNSYHNDAMVEVLAASKKQTNCKRQMLQISIRSVCELQVAEKSKVKRRLSIAMSGDFNMTNLWASGTGGVALEKYNLSIIADVKRFKWK